MLGLLFGFIWVGICWIYTYIHREQKNAAAIGLVLGFGVTLRAKATMLQSMTVDIVTSVLS